MAEADPDNFAALSTHTLDKACMHLGAEATDLLLLINSSSKRGPGGGRSEGTMTESPSGRAGGQQGGAGYGARVEAGYHAGMHSSHAEAAHACMHTRQGWSNVSHVLIQLCTALPCCFTTCCFTTHLKECATQCWSWKR